MTTELTVAADDQDAHDRSVLEWAPHCNRVLTGIVSAPVFKQVEQVAAITALRQGTRQVS
jgi:hypothetical protein